jgi:tetratricopeptide (TPR) repeat protein
VLLTLARAYEQAGYQKQSRLRYERAMALAADNPEARLGLAQAWRRDWLKFLEPRSLGRAIELYAGCVRIDPMRLEAWLQLSALEIERGNVSAASDAAERALAAEPGRADAMLAAASTRYRQGQVLASDTLFRRAIARLRRSVRERFEDFAPLATERDTTAYRRMSPEAREDYVRQFWREHDPDLATSRTKPRSSIGRASPKPISSTTTRSAGSGTSAARSTCATGLRRRCATTRSAPCSTRRGRGSATTCASR